VQEKWCNKSGATKVTVNVRQKQAYFVPFISTYMVRPGP